jgi:proline iminopeptidase
MSEQIPKGHFLLCANGSHLCMYDDQDTWFTGLIKFFRETENAM